MAQFLISLDEVERVKKLNRIGSTVELAQRTNVSRSTWGRALSTRAPKPDVLQALAALGARPDRILVADDLEALTA